MIPCGVPVGVFVLTAIVAAVSVTGEETFPNASLAQTLIVYGVLALRPVAVYEAEETVAPPLQLEAVEPCAMATK